MLSTNAREVCTFENRSKVLSDSGVSAIQLLSSPISDNSRITLKSRPKRIRNLIMLNLREINVFTF